MIISSSYSATKVYKFQATHFVFKHIFFAFIASLCCNFIHKQSKHLEKYAFVTWWISVILLIAVIFLGKSAKGAKRWINIFGFNLQPSEFMKIGVILQSSYFLNKNLYLYFLTYFIPISLIFMQPDLGTILLFVSLSCVQILGIQKNVDIKWFFIAILSIFCLITASYYIFPHVSERIDLFFFNKQDVYGSGYQSHKSFLCIISGGFLGKGFGKGEIKDLLPDAHTDYILAVIIEEFGALGGFFIALLFILLGLRCRKLIAKNEYLENVKYSVILIILGQAWMNMASTLALMPSKGITMPLISYGGSGLISQGIIFGILLAVSIPKSQQKQ